MEANVTITGHVGTDVDLRTPRTGMSVATFRLGCTPRVRRQGSWGDGVTTWITVTTFGALAENVHGSVGRGDPVLVNGRLRTEAWTSSDGEPRERLIIEAQVVGHDLSRGTTEFRKASRSLPVDESSELGEMIEAAEAEIPGGAVETLDADAA